MIYEILLSAAAVIATVIGGVWYLRGAISSKASVGAVDKLTESVNKLAVVVSGLDGRVNSMQNTLGSINSAIVAKAFGTTGTNSPLHLTDLGQKVATAIDADALLDKYYDDLKKEVGKSQPLDEYDTHEASIQAAFGFDARLSADERKILKKVAFDNGIILQEVLAVIAVKLRDKLLKEREQNREIVSGG